MRRITLVLGIAILLSATTAQAALIGVREFSRTGGSFFDATDMFPDAGTGAAIYVCVGGVDDCDILDIGAPMFGTLFNQSMLQITANNVFVQSPIGAAAEALLTNGSADTFSVLFSQCSNAASPGAGLCVGGGSGSGFGQTEYNFFGDNGDDPGLAGGVDFAGFDLTHVELEISNFEYARINLGSGQQVAWSYDAAIRIHGDAIPVAPIPEPHAALVFAIGLAAAARATRRR